MNRKLLVSLAALIFSTTIVMADDNTTTTNSRPEPPQFEQGNRPSMNGEQGRGPSMNNRQQGENSSMNNEGGNNGQFDGRRPKYKPDSAPGGKMEPKEWESSTSSSSGEDSIQGKQPPKMNENSKNDFKKGPRKDFGENNSNSETETE